LALDLAQVIYKWNVSIGDWNDVVCLINKILLLIRVPG
jgi:hypothetical protein